MVSILTSIKISLNIIVYLFFYIFATNTESVKDDSIIASYDYSLVYIMKAYVVIFVAVVTLLMNKMLS